METDNTTLKTQSVDQEASVSNPQPVASKSSFALWKVLLPVAIGLGVVVLMFIHDAQGENLQQVWE